MNARPYWIVEMHNNRNEYFGKRFKSEVEALRYYNRFNPTDDEHLNFEKRGEDCDTPINCKGNHGIGYAEGTCNK